MCGLLTVISRPGHFTDRQIESALDKIGHRGPDAKQLVRHDGGAYDVWMGHVRLAIVDLTDTGQQPMEVDSLVAVFNGEIYNHQQLRKNIPREFRGSSDTETLVSGVLDQGESFIEKCNGMFAFSIFNKTENSIFLGRDRLGKKPLYVYRDLATLIVSSELKPILELVNGLEIHEESLNSFRQFGFVIGTSSILKNVTRFPAASCAKIYLASEHISELKPVQYWDPFESYGCRSDLSYSDAVDAFLELLDDSTRLRMMSDVPIGIFLSGGIDSSLVATSLRHMNFNATAFTAGFESSTYNEADVALAFGRHLGIEIKTLPLNSRDFHRQSANLSKYFDEPFADSSQIPTMALSESAVKQVKVVLTGDGGDEPFLGYPRYSYPTGLTRILNYLDLIPGGRRAASHLLGSSKVDLAMSLVLKSLKMNTAHLDSKKKRLLKVVEQNDFWAIYTQVMSIGNVSTDAMCKNIKEKLQSIYPGYSWANLEGRSDAEKLSAVDLVGYLRDDVLVKTDRASMAYGLELRSPLLDYRIIEFAHSLPAEYKARGSVCKRILRDALLRRAPKFFTTLPKKGLSIPIPNLNSESSGVRVVDWINDVESKWRDKYGFLVENFY